MVRRPVVCLLVELAAAGLGCVGSGDERATSPSYRDAPAADALLEGQVEGLDATSDADGWSKGAVDGGSATEASTPQCPILQTSPASARAARSAGFDGAQTAYYALFGSPCQQAADCVPGCVAAGATMAACASGAQCTAGLGLDGGLGCLPPTFWLSVGGALSASGMTANAAQLVVVASPYDDSLVLSDFGIVVPDGALILGVTFDVRRATTSGNAVDEKVRILRNGSEVGTDHLNSEPWPTSLAYTTYGSAYDTWGIQWGPSDVRSSGFGISIAPRYTGPSSGNERAYIDSVQASVFYTAQCEGGLSD